MRFAYPMMLDLSDRLVVIVGGGHVAARKARGALDAGARRVRAVSPEFAADIPPEVQRVTARYDAEHLGGAGLVFAATDDPAINAAVVRDAHRLGILVNRADGDEDEPGDFSVPAVLRAGELVVTVSAGGAPALAAAIRDDLRSKLDPRWPRMAEAMNQLRPRITGRADLPAATRLAALRDLATDQAMEILEQHGVEGVWNWVKERSSTL